MYKYPTGYNIIASDLKPELVPPLLANQEVLSNHAACPNADPLRALPVLNKLHGQPRLDVEGLTGRHFKNVFLLL
jgi:hypothetical protein